MTTFMNSLDKLGDEYHYVSDCTYNEDLRTLYLPIDLVTGPNVVKFEKLMNSSNKE